MAVPTDLPNYPGYSVIANIRANGAQPRKSAMSLNEVSHVDCREDEENFLNKRHNGRHLAENFLGSRHNDVTASPSYSRRKGFEADGHGLSDWNRG